MEKSKWRKGYQLRYATNKKMKKGQNNNNYKKQTCNQKIGKEEILHSGLCIQSRQ